MEVPVERIVTRDVPVDRIVIKEVPVDRIVEKIVERPYERIVTLIYDISKIF